MPRFHKIAIDVEEVAVGAVMRLLHSTPGVVNVHYNMDDISYKQNKPNGAGRRRSQRGPIKQYEIKGNDFFVQVLAKAGKPVRTSAMSEAFERAGRSPHSG